MEYLLLFLGVILLLKLLIDYLSSLVTSLARSYFHPFRELEFKATRYLNQKCSGNCTRDVWGCYLDKQVRNFLRKLEQFSSPARPTVEIRILSSGRKCWGYEYEAVCLEPVQFDWSVQRDRGLLLCIYDDERKILCNIHQVDIPTGSMSIRPLDNEQLVTGKQYTAMKGDKATKYCWHTFECVKQLEKLKFYEILDSRARYAEWMDVRPTNVMLELATALDPDITCFTDLDCFEIDQAPLLPNSCQRDLESKRSNLYVRAIKGLLRFKPCRLFIKKRNLIYKEEFDSNMYAVNNKRRSKGLRPISRFQIDAMKSALSTRFAIIQKHEINPEDIIVSLARLFLHNRHLLRLKGPILVVARDNTSLSRLMLELMPYAKSAYSFCSLTYGLDPIVKKYNVYQMQREIGVDLPSRTSSASPTNNNLTGDERLGSARFIRDSELLATTLTYASRAHSSLESAEPSVVVIDCPHWLSEAGLLPALSFSKLKSAVIISAGNLHQMSQDSLLHRLKINKYPGFCADSARGTRLKSRSAQRTTNSNYNRRPILL